MRRRICVLVTTSRGTSKCVFCPQQRKEQERNMEYNEYLSRGRRVSDVQTDLLVSLVACGGYAHLLLRTM